MSEKVKKAVSAVQAKIAEVVAGLSKDEYEEVLGELDCEVATRKDALEDDRRLEQNEAIRLAEAADAQDGADRED